MRFAQRIHRSWQTLRRTGRSRKPPFARLLVEQIPPYLELFGKEEVPNSDWTVFGDQIERRLF